VTESSDDDLTSVSSGSEEVSLLKVWHQLVDDVVNVDEVLPDVGTDLSGGSLWILEDGSPGGDSLEVTLEVGAVTEVLWELGEEDTDILDTLEDVWDVLLLEGNDGEVNSLGTVLEIDEASSELSKSVLVGGVSDKSIEEVDHLDLGDSVFLGGDGGLRGLSLVAIEDTSWKEGSIVKGVASTWDSTTEAPGASSISITSGLGTLVAGVGYGSSSGDECVNHI
jgi:hypothetical protein